MTGIRKDYTGFRRPGSRLEVLSLFQRGQQTWAWCRCDCGTVCAKVMARVKNGDVKSCGCLQPWTHAQGSTA